MRTHRPFALAAVLLPILLFPGSTLAEAPAQCPAPQPPHVALAWELEAPWLGISWHGSLTLETTATATPVVERSAAPAVKSEADRPGLVDGARRAVKLVQAILRFHASLLEARHLF